MLQRGFSRCKSEQTIIFCSLGVRNCILLVFQQIVFLSLLFVLRSKDLTVKIKQEIKRKSRNN